MSGLPSLGPSSHQESDVTLGNDSEAGGWVHAGVQGDGCLATGESNVQIPLGGLPESHT